MSAARLSLLSATLVLAIAATTWLIGRRSCHCAVRWYGTGALLWIVAVALKVLFTMAVTSDLLAVILCHIPGRAATISAAALLGVQSSLFEIGVTLLAVLIWRRMGSSSSQAVCIGLGAGITEAALLGLASAAAAGAVLAGWPHSQHISRTIDLFSHTTPLFWLIAPVERLITIACHAASRALLLLVTVRRRYRWVIGGFALFAGLDTVAAWVNVSGKITTLSLWWIETALLPFAALGLGIIWRLLRHAEDN